MVVEQGAKPPAGTSIRSTETEETATDGLAFVTGTGLFRCQSAAHFAFMTQLVRAAQIA
jgi:hypothetical protein